MPFTILNNSIIPVSPLYLLYFNVTVGTAWTFSWSIFVFYFCVYTFIIEVYAITPS